MKYRIKEEIDGNDEVWYRLQERRFFFWRNLKYPYRENLSDVKHDFYTYKKYKNSTQTKAVKYHEIE